MCKGEESGHTQVVRGIYLDCDADTILLKVEQTGAACHEGYHNCFFRQVTPSGLKVIAEKLIEPSAAYPGKLAMKAATPLKPLEPLSADGRLGRLLSRALWQLLLLQLQSVLFGEIRRKSSTSGFSLGPTLCCLSVLRSFQRGSRRATRNWNGNSASERCCC